MFGKGGVVTLLNATIAAANSSGNAFSVVYSRGESPIPPIIRTCAHHSEFRCMSWRACRLSMFHVGELSKLCQ